MPKAKIIGLSGLAAALAFGSLVAYSYSRLLAVERQFMPPLSSLPTPHEREVSFRILELWSTRLPHWTVRYREKPVTDTEYIDPAITVDIFGRIADTASKRVGDAVGRFNLQQK